MKKGTAIYDYLHQAGVLEKASAIEIEAAKKIYWKNVRKKWKQDRSKQKKGYTVFLSKEEVFHIKKIIGTKRSGVTGYIHQATHTALINKNIVDKDVVGKVRLELYRFYNKMAEATNNKESPVTTNQLLSEIETVQHTILSILQGKNSNA